LQRRQHILDTVKHLLLRENQVQPLILLFEDLHWIDAGIQAMLDSLLGCLPSAGCACSSTTVRSTTSVGGGRPVVFEFSCCCAIVRVPMCHGVRRRRIMAVVHVQCPQCQSIEVVEYGKQANGTQR